MVLVLVLENKRSSTSTASLCTSTNAIVCMIGGNALEYSTLAMFSARIDEIALCENGDFGCLATLGAWHLSVSHLSVAPVGPVQADTSKKEKCSCRRPFFLKPHASCLSYIRQTLAYAAANLDNKDLDQCRH